MALKKQERIIKLYFKEGLDEKTISKKVGIAKTIVWQIIVKERTKRKHEAARARKEGAIKIG